MTKNSMKGSTAEIQAKLKKHKMSSFLKQTNTFSNKQIPETRSNFDNYLLPELI